MENTKITVELELSSETYAHVANISNLGELLKRVCEKELYRFVLEDLT
jgi:hypothetical protein